MSLLSKFLSLGSNPKAGQLYGAAVAQARTPAFYSAVGANDTPDGRLALISLHVLLILERLSGPITLPEGNGGAKGPAIDSTTDPEIDLEADAGAYPRTGPRAGRGTGATNGDICQNAPSYPTAHGDPALGQALMDVFVSDLDQAMRELGIGDMGVPKRVKKAMAQFYDYARRYRALRQHQTTNALHALLSDMIPGLNSDSAGLIPLASYVRDVDHALARQATRSLAAGNVTFPDFEVPRLGETPALGRGEVL